MSSSEETMPGNNRPKRLKLRLKNLVEITKEASDVGDPNTFHILEQNCIQLVICISFLSHEYIPVLKKYEEKMRKNDFGGSFDQGYIEILIGLSLYHRY